VGTTRGFRPVNRVGGLDELEIKIEIEMDHGGLCLAFRGSFPGCVAQLGSAFRGVPLLECRQGCGTAGMPEPGLADARWSEVSYPCLRFIYLRHLSCGR
jgi:hypothetical protein